MTNNTKIISGILLLILSCLVLISMVSFMFSWKEDLSAIAVIFNDGIEIKNISNKLGLISSYFLIYLQIQKFLSFHLKIRSSSLMKKK